MCVCVCVLSFVIKQLGANNSLLYSFATWESRSLLRVTLTYGSIAQLIDDQCQASSFPRETMTSVGVARSGLLWLNSTLRQTIIAQWLPNMSK